MKDNPSDDGVPSREFSSAKRYSSRPPAPDHASLERIPVDEMPTVSALLTHMNELLEREKYFMLVPWGESGKDMFDGKVYMVITSQPGDAKTSDVSMNLIMEPNLQSRIEGSIVRLVHLKEPAMSREARFDHHGIARITRVPGYQGIGTREPYRIVFEAMQLPPSRGIHQK